VITALVFLQHGPAVTAMAALLAACQPLPHPFANDVPRRGSPILVLRDSASVTIAPIDGTPRATAEKLGERTERLEAPAGDWQQGAEDAVARLAAASADRLAALLQDEPPTEAELGGHTRLLISGVEGAPGDGGQSLPRAITEILKRQDVAIVTDPQATADLVLDAEIVVATPKAGKQNVKIVWRVRRKDGGEIGTVGQENDVPAGLLDGAWGDVAYMVAVSAQDGIMQLLARGAPSSTGKS
jgi:hypothetical protein